MHRVFISALLLFLGCIAGIAAVQENHCQEAGTGVLLTRSPFAHGYRHGYEAGYHEGNIDINMARKPRTTFKQFKGLPLGYERRFGAKKSFEFGFALGLKAGYSDGYAGKKFRAVEGLRYSASFLASGATADPSNLFFDRGLTLGYKDGFAKSRNSSDEQGAAVMEINSVPCDFHPSRPRDLAAEPAYCDGYRRGYVLGHGDGVALGPEPGLLEASK